MTSRTQASAWSEPEAVWAAARANEWAGSGAGVCPDYVQANLVIVPSHDAFDFLRFCLRNPGPCPILEVLDPGQVEPMLANGADLRTDVSGYHVFREGRLVEKRSEIRDIWSADLVAFLLGCSYSFDRALQAAGIPVRHIDHGVDVPAYITDRACEPAGRLSGRLVVSMRPIASDHISRAVTITALLPHVHGAPVHIGSPQTLGIRDLSRPDWGSAVEVLPGEIPVFWACGATAQEVALASKPSLMITHDPDGLMFVTKRRLNLR